MTCISTNIVCMYYVCMYVCVNVMCDMCFCT